MDCVMCRKPLPAPTSDPFYHAECRPLDPILLALTHWNDAICNADLCVPDEDAVDEEEDEDREREPDYLDDPDNVRYEREALRASLDDFRATGGKDWR